MVAAASWKSCVRAGATKGQVTMAADDCTLLSCGRKGAGRPQMVLFLLLLLLLSSVQLTHEGWGECHRRRRYNTSLSHGQQWTGVRCKADRPKVKIKKKLRERERDSKSDQKKELPHVIR